MQTRKTREKTVNCGLYLKDHQYTPLCKLQSDSPSSIPFVRCGRCLCVIVMISVGDVCGLDTVMLIPGLAIRDPGRHRRYYHHCEPRGVT